MSKGNKQLEKFTEVEVEDEDAAVNHFAELPSVIQRRVLALKKLHKEHLSLEKKYREEVLALERKYQNLYAPLFLKRATVVSGEHEPTDEEARIDGEEPVKADAKDKDIKGIPEFWLTVMKNNRSVGETITEADEEAIKYLRDVRYTRVEGDKSGFQLSFHFAENPYFTNTVLTKTYNLVDDDNLFGELVFDHAEGCEIKWKPSKNLTVKLVKKQQKARPQRGGKKGGGGGAGRIVTKEEPCDSFFQFFSPPGPNDAEDDEEGLVDDLLEADFETGVIFKDKLIPHAALWFTGEALEYEDDDYDFDEFDEGDFDDEDDDDEDDDDDEEEEEEEERPKKGGRGSGGQPPAKKSSPARGQLPPPASKGAPGQPQQPECKQQ